MNARHLHLLALLVSALASCADSAAPRVATGDGSAVDLSVPDTVDAPLAPECAIVLHLMDGGAECVVEWSCRDAGVLALACSAVDGGIECACGSEAQAPIPLSAVPTSCAAPDVTESARINCGWTWL